MSDILEKSPSQGARNPSLGIWAGIIISVIYLIFFGFSVSIVISQGHFFWTDTLLMTLTGLTGVSSLISIFLIQKGRYALGTGFIYLANLIPPVVAAISLIDISLITSTYIVLSSFFLFYWVLPRKKRNWAIRAGVLALILSTLADIINPAFQAETTGLEDFAPFIIGIMGLAFLALLLQQVWTTNIRPKLLVAIFISLGVVIFYQTGVNLRISRELSEAAEYEKLLALYDHYNEDVEILTNASSVLSVSYADRSDIKELFLSQDRDALLTLLSPTFEILKDEYNIQHLYIEKPDGTVYLRVHNPEKYGDDITYRHTAAAALQSQKTVAGVEVGPGRIGIRSVSPLFDNGKFIGLLEVGLDYDQEFIDNLKADHNTDYNLWITYDAAKTPGLAPEPNAPSAPIDQVFYYAGSNPLILPIAPEVYEQVLSDGEMIVEFVSVEGQELAVVIAPMLGYGDRIIGILEILTPRSETLATINQTRQSVLIPAFLLTFAGLLVLGFVINQVVLRPVKHLAAVAEKQIAGDLSSRVEILPPDELGYLGNTLNILAEQLDTTQKSQEEVIAERTKNLEEHSAYLESSAEISRAVASMTNVDELITQVVSLIREQFDLYYVGLFLVDQRNEWAILQAGTGKAGQAMLERKHRLKIGEGMIGWCVANAESRIALDVGEDAVRFDNPDLPDTHSEGALPLRSRGRVLGALTIQSNKTAAFTPEIITTLQTMADQIAIALDNAELLAKSELALTAERRAYGELSQKDWLALLQRKNIPAYTSETSEDVQAIEILLPSAEKLKSLQDGPVLDDNGSTAIIPIKIHDHLLGGIKLYKEKESDTWTNEQLELAETLAEQLSISLESARLFEETQLRAERERIIGETSAHIRETLDIERVLETAAQELHKILGEVETEVWLDAE